LVDGGWLELLVAVLTHRLVRWSDEVGEVGVDGVGDAQSVHLPGRPGEDGSRVDPAVPVLRAIRQ
jgi:hypothetical protein